MDSTAKLPSRSKSIPVFQAYSSVVTLLKKHGKKLSDHHYLLALQDNRLSLPLAGLSEEDVQSIYSFFNETPALSVTDTHLNLDIADCQDTELVATIYNSDAGYPSAITLSGLSNSKEAVWLGLKETLAINYNSLDSSKPTFFTVGTPKNLSEIQDKNVVCFPSLDYIQKYSELLEFFTSHNFEAAHVTVLLNKGHFNSAGSLFKIQHNLTIPSTSDEVFVSKGDILFDQGFDSQGNLLTGLYYGECNSLVEHRFITNCDCTQEQLSDYLSTLFDIKHRAKESGCSLQNIRSLDDLRFPQVEPFPFVVDCSPTGTGKSSDLINQVTKYLDGQGSVFAEDKRIIIVVPNFNNIPAKLLLRDEVVLSWGRQFENFAIVESDNHYNFKRQSALESTDNIVRMMEANCGDQMLSSAKGQCSGCGKPKDECEYNKHLTDAKEGFPNHKVIITTMGNSENLFGKLLPLGEKFHIVEDDLNFINDSYQINISSNDSWLYRMANRYHEYGSDLETDLFYATLESLVFSLTETKFQVTQEAFNKNQKFSLPEKEDVLESITDSESSLTYEQAVKIVNTAPKAEMEETIYHNGEISEIRKIRDRSLDILKAHYPLISSASFDHLDWKKLQGLGRTQWAFFKVLEAIYKPAFENLASSQKMSKAKGFYQFNTTVRLKSRGSKFFLGSTTIDDNDLVTFPVFAALNETVLTVNMSKTLPERYENFAGSLLRISADDFFDSYHTVGKKPDMVIYRESDFKPTLIRTINNKYEHSMAQLPPNAAVPYIRRMLSEELNLKTGALQVMHPEIEVPENIKHVIFDVKEVKQKVIKLFENKNITDLAFKQYFGDEVGSNDLYNKEFNCATLRTTKTQNISSLLLFQGRDCGTFIRKISINFGSAEAPRFENVTIINNGINLARQNIMLNQAFGRLRANRQDSSLAFIAQSEFVNLNTANVIDIDMAEAASFNIKLKHREYESKAEFNAELTAEGNIYIAFDAITHTEKEELTWLEWTREFKNYGKTSGYSEMTALFAENLDMRKRIKLTKEQVLQATMKLLAYYLVWQQRVTVNLSVLTGINKLSGKINNPLSVIQTLKAHQGVLQAIIDDLEPKFMEWYPENYQEIEEESPVEETFKLPAYLKAEKEVYPEDAIQAYSFSLESDIDHLPLEEVTTFNLQSIWRSEVTEAKSSKWFAVKDFFSRLAECCPEDVPMETLIPLNKLQYKKLYAAMFEYMSAVKRGSSEKDLTLIRNATKDKLRSFQN